MFDLSFVRYKDLFALSKATRRVGSIPVDWEKKWVLLNQAFPNESIESGLVAVNFARINFAVDFFSYILLIL